MDIRTTRVDSAVIMRLEGRLTAETGSAWLQTAVVAATAEGARHVLLDLGGIRQLDCTGIGQLLGLRERIHGARRSVALTCVGRRQKRMLEMSGLIHVFRVFVDNQAGVAALGLRERTADLAFAEAAAMVPLTACWNTAPGWPALGCAS